MDIDKFEMMAYSAIDAILNRIEDANYPKFTSYYVSNKTVATVPSLNNAIKDRNKIKTFQAKTFMDLLRFYTEEIGDLQLPKEEVTAQDIADIFESERTRL